MKKIFLLGATGSIGLSTIEIARTYNDKIKIVGLSGNYNDELLSKLGHEFKTDLLILTGKEKSDFSNIKYFGTEELITQIKKSDADIVVNGIAGSSGLLPSIAAIESGKDIALANKETLVMAGPLIRELSDKSKSRILPVDSEHSAIFHLTENINEKDIAEIIITASGGAFRDKTIDELKHVTLEDALNHPTWSMGKKITIDSASMANKGLEVIEAAMLFNIKPEKIKVLIHPQSYVHSLIRLNDCSMYAQISSPDMKLPIQNALFYPDIEPVQSAYLDLANKNLTFSTPDLLKYPMLDLAYKALEKGNEYTIAYNAVNEIAVEYFVKGTISFTDIPQITEKILNTVIDTKADSVNNILEIDKSIRLKTVDLIGKYFDI